MAQLLLVLTVGRDVLLLTAAALPPLAAGHTLLDESGAAWVPVAALAAVCVGALAALRGPYVRRVDIPVEELAPDLIALTGDIVDLVGAAAGGPRRAARGAPGALPKIAPLAEQAGLDLQLSGRTHAGQFFPWTFVIHLVHGPHAAGLSRRGRLWVYVSAGAGDVGSSRAPRHQARAHPPAPRGRERTAPPLAGVGLPQVRGSKGARRAGH
jgi:hypothetical protein